MAVLVSVLEVLGSVLTVPVIAAAVLRSVRAWRDRSWGFSRLVALLVALSAVTVAAMALALALAGIPTLLETLALVDAVLLLVALMPWRKPQPRAGH